MRRAIGLSFAGHRFKPLESFLPKQYYECSNRQYPLSRLFFFVPTKGICQGTGAAFIVANVGGMSAIDFEEPTMCREGSLDEVFNSILPMDQWKPFGSRVSYEYSLYVTVGGANGAKQASIELQAAPDRPSTPKVTLDCVLKTTP